MTSRSATRQFVKAVKMNSCYYSCACGQIFFCFKRHANEANGSTQSKIDPFASFACQTADNCNNSYSKTAMKRLQSTFAAKLRKANYLSISVMRLKLAELNWLKLTLPNPTYKALVFRN